ncbi:MAG: GNAT family N-acetyltransferase [Acidobacteria bacterium]|nr:GNAT family N-acetyltransferase [Acidobacteriota bacterium]
MNLDRITLTGENVTLEPLGLEHADPLCEFGLDEKLWKLIPTRVATRRDMAAYIETALEQWKKGVSLPFATTLTESHKIVGCTRFCNIDASNHRAEIGWTWIDPKWQRSFVNTEVKLLMLAHAFEVWGCVRVELKTDALNEQSRAAILRIGAKEEGILRQHMITDSGRFRDTVYFSILDNEWAEVKTGLIEKLRTYK